MHLQKQMLEVIGSSITLLKMIAGKTCVSIKDSFGGG
jgi:hypothetical protein